MKLYSFIRSEKTEKTLGANNALVFDLYHNKDYGKKDSTGGINKLSNYACSVKFSFDGLGNPYLVISDNKTGKKYHEVIFS